MKHLEQRVLYLFLFLIGASTLGWYINSYTPDTVIHILLFYILLGISLFFIFLCLFGQLQRSIIFSTTILSLFILRSFHLRHPIYSILLLACVFSFVYSLEKRKHTQ